MSMGDKSSENVAGSTHHCVSCDYYTGKLCNFNKHLLTAKHLMVTNGDKLVARIENGEFVCICGNTYKHRQGLHRHKKDCDGGGKQNDEIIITPTPLIDAGLVVSLLKKNQELQELLVEQHKQMHEHMQEQAKQQNELVNKLVERDTSTTNNNTTNNNTINNNNNQKFNLNFFLNETCKDAMNLKDFIDNIYITFEELMLISDTGFVNGVTDIFIKRLRELDVTKRPIHCTDIKRETIFIRDDNTWYKDDQDNTKLKAAIERIEYRNVVALNKWCAENPAAMINNTEENLLRDKIYLQTLLGDKKTREKIIRNLSKELAIDKKEFLKN
jgi:hypothetical protein